MAVVADADGDASGLDAAEDLTGAPDMEAPEIQGVPDAGDDATSAGDESSDDASGGSSGGSSGGGSGSGTVIDSGSGAPPGEPVDASVGSGSIPDSGSETTGPTSLEGGRETGAPHLGGVVSLHAAPGGTAGGSPSSVDDTPTFGDDSSSSPSDDGAAPTWGGTSDDGGSPNLDLPPARAVIGCAGCTVPDAAGPGALAWAMVALIAGTLTWRRRR